MKFKLLLALLIICSLCNFIEINKKTDLSYNSSHQVADKKVSCKTELVILFLRVLVVRSYSRMNSINPPSAIRDIPEDIISFKSVLMSLPYLKFQLLEKQEKVLSKVKLETEECLKDSSNINENSSESANLDLRSIYSRPTPTVVNKLDNLNSRKTIEPIKYNESINLYFSNNKLKVTNLDLISRNSLTSSHKIALEWKDNQNNQIIDTKFELKYKKDLVITNEINRESSDVVIVSVGK